jgi:hypothetical protein
MSGIRRVSDLGSKGVSNILDGSIQAADLSPTIPLSGFRNLIINGDFRINQRGYTSGTSLSSGVYGFDRWKVVTGPLALTFTSAPQGQQITILAFGQIRQVVERANITAGTYVLSWTGTAGGRVYNEGASTVPSYNTGNSLTFVLDGTANVNVEFSAAGSSATLGEVQLEQNFQPTPFEQRPIGVELALCQRYYWRSTSGLTTDGNSRHAHFRRLNAYQMIATGHCSFPVPMRAEPSVSLYSGNGIGFVDAYGAGQESYVIASAEGLSTFGFGMIVKYTNSGLGTTANFAGDPASYSYWMNIEASAEL